MANQRGRKERGPTTEGGTGGAPPSSGDVADREGAAAAEPAGPLRAGGARALLEARRALRQRPLPGGLPPRCVRAGAEPRGRGEAGARGMRGRVNAVRGLPWAGRGF